MSLYNFASASFVSQFNAMRALLDILDPPFRAVA